VAVVVGITCFFMCMRVTVIVTVVVVVVVVVRVRVVVVVSVTVCIARFFARMRVTVIVSVSVALGIGWCLVGVGVVMTVIMGTCSWFFVAFMTEQPKANQVEQQTDSGNDHNGHSAFRQRLGFVGCFPGQHAGQAIDRLQRQTQTEGQEEDAVD
jgi:hypothetical protein